MTDETQKTITSWQMKTFGHCTVEAALKRMDKEYVELMQAIHAGDFYRAGKECPDVLITLYRVAELLGVNLLDEVDEKMVINRKRKWLVAADGTGQHL